MKLLARYITSLFIKNYLVVIATLVAIQVFQSMLGYFIDSDHPAQQILFLHLLYIPEYVVLMSPPAVMIATMLTLSGMNRSSELIACYSIGLSLKQIVLMIFSVALIISSILLVLQDRVLPPLQRKRANYYWRVMKNRQDFYFDVKQNKIWYRSKNLIYNLRTFDATNKVIYGMKVYEFDPSFHLNQVIEAKQATYTSEGWDLQEGTRTVFGGPDEDFPKTKPFRKYRLQIAETPTDFQEIEKEIDGLRIKELYQYIQRVKDAGADVKAYMVKLHSRLSLSFIPLVMCLLAIPFSVRGRREGGFARDLAVGLAVTFFYWILYSIGLSFGISGALPPWMAAWAPSFLFLILAVTLIMRKRT